ncbi:MAG TPA: sulfite oxidase [Candidatus Eisenbacteria bacterium]
MDPRSRPHEWTPLSTEPLNGGTHPTGLADLLYTPASRFFVRNHGPVPEIDLASWRLRVDGLVAHALEFTFDELIGRYRRTRRPATIQCAGFRRTGLSRVRPIPGELPWSEESVGTAEWEGVLLADVLADAAPRPGARHAAFEGCDVCEREERRFGFGGSVWIEEVAAQGILLATSMNGEPLSAEHGWPLRVVAPNVIGARSVKWLTRIELRQDPSDNYFQARTYKILPMPQPTRNEWSAAPPLGRLPVNALICRPGEGASVPAGRVAVGGFAWTGHEEGISRVELSTDGGHAWQPARLEPAEMRGVWQRWTAEPTLAPGRHELVVRAVDAGGACQPDDPALLWNARGYLNNAWQRVAIDVA